MLAFSLFIMGNFLMLHKPPDYKALTVKQFDKLEFVKLIMLQKYVLD